MKFRIFITSSLIIGVIIIFAGFQIRSRDDGRTALLNHKIPLVMREIGHHLLLKAGDSTSRVLPVKRLHENIFQIEFQSPFQFVPDTLMKVIHSSLSSAVLPMPYFVNVRDCFTNEVVYGFSIGNEKNIVPCGGRKQPTGCYSIQIVLTGVNTTAGGRNHFVWLLPFVIATICGFVYFGNGSLKKKSSIIAPEKLLSVGKYDFSVERGILRNGKELIQLSEKESGLLEILVNNQNQLIERNRLLKEIWEDHGVVVGRSLDVFISKLRKKLQHDPSIRIVNIHGRGYKLESVSNH